MIYLDNAATTMVDPAFKDVIDEFLYNNYGNANSNHVAGIEPSFAVDYARGNAAKFFNGNKDDVIFTSGGSEANTLAIVGLANYLKSIKKCHIITTKYEHHSVLNAMKEMERRGFLVTYLDVPDGVADIDQLKMELREDTGLVSVMYVNNEVGTINNVKEIYKLCRSNDTIFHSDCVQAAGTFELDQAEVADLMSVSGHKFHAPKGIGCLYTKFRDKMTPIIFGGEQEGGKRGGTENVAFIAAFGDALEKTRINMTANNDKMRELALEFLDKLSQKECSKISQSTIADAVTVNKIISMRFDGIDSETLINMLSSRGVCISAGSACSSHQVQPSHVLKAIGLTNAEASSTIRVSFSDLTTSKEITEFIDILDECVQDIQKMNMFILEE